MEMFKHHVFVCDQQKAEGVPCCSARGGAAVLDALRAEVARQGLGATVQVTMCGSLGLCERGPNMVVYPEGTWYSGVQPADVPELVEHHFKNGRPVARLVNGDAAALRAEMGQNRARMVAALRHRDESGVLPDALQQTIRGFQESRVALTAIELDVFTAVGSGATAAEAAAKTSADERAVEMLLNALVAMRLLDKRGAVFSNTPVAATYLAAGGAHDSRAALMHSVHLWTTWSRLTDSVRSGSAAVAADDTRRAQRDRDGAERGSGASASDGAEGRAGAARDSWTGAFIAAMHKNASERAMSVVAAVPMDRARRMLDVGGGSGAYSIAFAQAHPDLKVDLLDLPEVTGIAARHIAAANLNGRIRLRDDDLRSATFGRNEYDLILLSAICHMLSPDENRDLLTRCAAAAAPAGRVVIQDFIMDSSKTAPKSGALFALNMLVGTARGNTYSDAEYTDWLRGAGFTGVQHVSLRGPTGLMIGVK